MFFPLSMFCNVIPFRPAYLRRPFPVLRLHFFTEQNIPIPLDQKIVFRKQINISKVFILYYCLGIQGPNNWRSRITTELIVQQKIFRVSATAVAVRK